MPTLLVFGARRLGGAIVDRFVERGYDVACVALSDETANGVRERHPRALALAADVSHAPDVERVVDQTLGRFGSIDVAVNAVSPLRRGIVTGGPLTDLAADAIQPYTKTLLPTVFHFLGIVGRPMADAGRGTLIQVTGGSARRAMPQRGPWADQLQGKSADSSTTHADVLHAVDFLVDQTPRGWTHELTITPVGDRWVP